jgi:hypothetical protein
MASGAPVLQGASTSHKRESLLRRGARPCTPRPASVTLRALSGVDVIVRAPTAPNATGRDVKCTNLGLDDLHVISGAAFGKDSADAIASAKKKPPGHRPAAWYSALAVAYLFSVAALSFS